MAATPDVATLLRLLEAEKAARREAEKNSDALRRNLDCSMQLKAAVDLSAGRAKAMKSVDLCFVIDCTYSMRAQIDAAKAKVRKIINHIVRAMGTGAWVRCAIVGYRDVGYKEHPVVSDFTPDPAESQRFLDKLEAQRQEGNDECEDVLTGLDAAAKLVWEGRSRILFLIGDNPNHGGRFHKWPKGHKNDSLWETDRQWDFTDNLLARLRSSQIRLVCLKLKEDTDKMFSVFASVYDKNGEDGCFRMLVEPLAFDHASFYKTVMRASWKSIEESLSSETLKRRQAREADPKNLQSMNLEERPIDWSTSKSWPKMKVELLSYTVVDLQLPAKVDKVPRTMRLATAPFARGGMRYAFPLMDESSGAKLVAKVYVYKDAEHTSFGVFEGDMKAQADARFLALDWSRRLPDSPLQFVQAQIMRCPNGAPFEFMAIEPFIPGNYEKQTNNASYVSSDSELAQAFSHFTWHISAGKLMVTDIQGVRATLTDPQIHSENASFGRGNFGLQGMDNFFLSHRCGSICESLNLMPNPMQLKGFVAGDEDTGGIGAGDVCPPQERKEGQGAEFLCEGKCGKMVPSSERDYVKLSSKLGFFCAACRVKVDKTTSYSACVTDGCDRLLRYSTFALNCRGEEAPMECSVCREEREAASWVDCSGHGATSS